MIVAETDSYVYRNNGIGPVQAAGFGKTYYGLWSAGIPTFVYENDIDYVLYFRDHDSHIDSIKDNVKRLSQVSTVIVSSGDLISRRDVEDVDILSEYCVPLRTDSWDVPLLSIVKERYVCSPGTIDNRVFYPSRIKRNVVNMIGTIRGRADREKIYSLLSQHNIPVLTGGGEIHNDNENKFSMDEYAQLLRSSRITVNTPGDIAKPQTKGRVWEATASGSLLVEIKNSATAAYFIPGKDYVEVECIDTIAETVKYYMQHREEAEYIAISGHNTFTRNYAPNIVWNKIIEKVNVKNTVRR